MRSPDASFRTNVSYVSRGGFTLVGLLALLVLFAVFMLVATEVFVQTVRLTKGSTQATVAGDHVDTVVDRLRRDIWNAHSIEVPDAQHVVIESTTAGAAIHIVWAIDPAGGVQRTQDAPAAVVQHWNGLPAMTFAPTAQRSALHLAVTDSGGPQQFLLPSQIRLAEANP